MLVLLPTKFRHLGCPAAFGGTSRETVGSNVLTNYILLQAEYKGKWRIRVTVCNVPEQLNGDVLAAYLSKYGSVEAVTSMRAADGTVHGD